MAGMKISLDSAMRARDVSQPQRADEEAAELAEAAIADGRPLNDNQPAKDIRLASDSRPVKPSAAHGKRPAGPAVLPESGLSAQRLLSQAALTKDGPTKDAPTQGPPTQDPPAQPDRTERRAGDNRGRSRRRSSIPRRPYEQR